jgi:hypothetical protein
MYRIMEPIDDCSTTLSYFDSYLCATQIISFKNWCPTWLVIIPSTLTLKVSTQLSLLKTLFYHFLYFSRKLWKPQQCNINCTEHFWAILLDTWPVRVVRKPHTLCLILHCDCEIKICNIVTFLFILNIMWLDHSILIGRFNKWPVTAVSWTPGA